jgi:pimeloyl-ACP methyl ester carboxylesterase
MEKVVSRDGTPIAFDRVGDGPPLILVDGALCHRTFGPMPKLAPLLTRDFTVFTYDRRGRGDSGDTAPYAVDREVDDIEALIKAAGRPAFVYGVSSGAALALEAANRGLAIEKLALFEAPFIVDDSRTPLLGDYEARINELIAADNRSEVIKQFMKAVGLPAIVIFMMRFMPAWSKLKAVAHTVAYDTAILRDYQRGQPLPANRWTAVRMPTLVAVGGKSPAWMGNAMRELADAIPHAKRLILPGQTHMVDAKVHAPMLTEFFRGQA